MTLQELTDAQKKELKVEGGVLVSEATGVAARAGIRRGDIIVRLGNDPIDSAGDLFGALRDSQPGDTVELTVVRDGRAVPNFMSQALRNEEVTIFGSGSQTRSFCYISDLVDGILRLLDACGIETATVAGDLVPKLGEALSVGDETPARSDEPLDERRDDAEGLSRLLLAEEPHTC